MEIEKNSLDYLNKNMKVTDSVIKRIINHCKRYNIKPEICAYYSNWEDFCSDWCDGLGYTKTEVRKIYNGGKGEFLTLNTGEIMRFVL